MADEAGDVLEEGGYLWHGQLRLWDNELLMGWYAADDGAVRSKGTMYFVIHAHGMHLLGRWVGLSYDGKIVTGWAANGEGARQGHEPDRDAQGVGRHRASGMSDELCEVVITAPDADWLVQFGRRLVSDRLAASVHNLGQVRSVYQWQGETQDRYEARAAVHTRVALMPSIVERLDAEHPYEVPGVFALPIIATSPAYRAWVLDQTAAST